MNIIIIVIIFLVIVIVNNIFTMLIKSNLNQAKKINLSESNNYYIATMLEQNFLENKYVRECETNRYNVFNNTIDIRGINSNNGYDIIQSLPVVGQFILSGDNCIACIIFRICNLLLLFNRYIVIPSYGISIIYHIITNNRFILISNPYSQLILYGIFIFITSIRCSVGFVNEVLANDSAITFIEKLNDFNLQILSRKIYFYNFIKNGILAIGTAVIICFYNFFF